MSQGGTTSTGIGLPVAVSQGGTGLTSSGTSGNILTSNGSNWVSSAPATQAYNYGLTYIMARGIY